MFLLLVSVILYQLGVVGKSTVSVNLFMKENLHDSLVVNKWPQDWFNMPNNHTQLMKSIKIKINSYTAELGYNSDLV